MRLRHINGAIEGMRFHPLVVQNPLDYKGMWDTFFGNKNPIVVEIGTGKGDFIIQKALRYPEMNFIGIEKYSAVIAKAVVKLETIQSKVSNLALIRFDAEDLLAIFEVNEITTVILNFSDPWPKDRYAKRRLTNVKYLDMYKQMLPVYGNVIFKTDNEFLFAYSLEEIGKTAFVITKTTTDFHNSEFVVDNIMTEYEKRFVAKGKNINYVELLNVK